MKNEKKDPALKMPTPAEVGGESGTSQLKKLMIDSLQDIYWAENQLGYNALMSGDDKIISGLKNKVSVTMSNVMSESKGAVMMKKQ